ncbi:hypothetical protein [Dysgonomonas sp. 520]|uniref:hypothetical protein n=1 Tax=Dysgonomonas sp. 520 TaxID=2302931 RepID=UPI0013D17191|nr:hypothetical protein [Dysgonomonas sp. 520]NDW10007.1 hypothetical protein [Dysgonomonas sp. 520]
MESKQPAIKVGFLISYDYKYVKEALPLVYPFADYIAFAIDKDRKTWSGNNFILPESFFDWVREYDVDNKIHIYEDSFYVSELSSIECDVRERNMLSSYMGLDGWHIFVDSDEYFLDFENFVKYIKSLNANIPTQIYAGLITLFQKDDNGYFVINTHETYPVATNNPRYVGCRLSENFEISLYTNFKVLHQSWARDNDEIKQKLSNWGHKTDFDVEAYYNFWKAINKQTYRYVRSFHPLDPWLWPSLEYFEAKDIQELTRKVKDFLQEKENAKNREDNIRLKDIIPPILYKLKARLKKK